MWGYFSKAIWYSAPSSYLESESSRYPYFGDKWLCLFVVHTSYSSRMNQHTGHKTDSNVQIHSPLHQLSSQWANNGKSLWFQNIQIIQLAEIRMIQSRLQLWYKPFFLLNNHKIIFYNSSIWFFTIGSNLDFMILSVNHDLISMDRIISTMRLMVSLQWK